MMCSHLICQMCIYTNNKCQYFWRTTLPTSVAPRSDQITSSNSRSSDLSPLQRQWFRVSSEKRGIRASRENIHRSPTRYKTLFRCNRQMPTNDGYVDQMSYHAAMPIKQKMLSSKNEISSIRTCSLIVARVQRKLWEDTGINKSEKVPFGASFGLEVPEDPTIGHLLIHLDLSLDILSRIVFQSLIPGIDEVYGIARTYPGCIWLITVILSPDAVSIERSSAICHCGSPFADNHPVVDISGICACMTAHELSMFFRCALQLLCRENLVLMSIDYHCQVLAMTQYWRQDKLPFLEPGAVSTPFQKVPF